MVPFKFLQSNRMTEYYSREINPPSQRRRIAVIAYSIEDFNNWKRDILRGTQREHWNHPSVCVVGNDRYEAVLTINHTRGRTYDDFILTPRAYEHRDHEIIEEIITIINRRIRINNDTI